jgi:hypothetical protein
MREKLSATVVGVVISIGTTAAADRPALDPAKAPSVVRWNLAGLSAGRPIGRGFGHRTLSDPVVADTDGLAIGTTSARVGARIGVNGRVPHRRWLFGVEVDIARWEGREEDHLRGSQFAGPGGSIDAIEIGTRVRYSSGRPQNDFGSSADPSQSNIPNVRLPDESTATSGDVLGRIDGVSDIFVEGFAGDPLLSGRPHHEERALFHGKNLVPYLNLVSDSVKGSVDHGTGDIGYTFLSGAGYNVGGFIGYSAYAENNSAGRCTQIANALSACAPTLPGSALVMTENGSWNSLRIGLDGVLTLWNRVKLTTGAARLPNVRFASIDNHLLPTGFAGTTPLAGGQGRSRGVTSPSSVGTGGRSWAMGATYGPVRDPFDEACPCQTLPARTERSGGFLQASYKIDGVQ